MHTICNASYYFMQDIKLMIERITGKELEQISSETSFKEIGLNSYELITLIGEIEETYDIEISNRVIRKLNTIGDILDLIS